jgi:hypothetical protein
LPYLAATAASERASWWLRLTAGCSREVSSRAPDLVELVARPKDNLANLERLARTFLKALARAGIVKALADRAPGAAPTSNGNRRFKLVRDLGRRAPITGRDFITDPNADGVDNARIPYQVEKLPPASRRKA